MTWSADAKRKYQFVPYPTESKSIYSMAISEDGKILAAGDGQTIKIFDTFNQSIVKEYKDGHTNTILCIDISNDKTYLVSGGKDSMIVVRNLDSGDIVREFNPSLGIITDIKIAPDGSFFVAGGTNKTVHVYDFQTCKLTDVFNNHQAEITALAISNDNKYIATAGADHQIFLHFDEFKSHTRISGHRNWVRAIKFTTDITKLISCGDDGQVLHTGVVNPHRVFKVGNKTYKGGWLTSLDLTDNNKTIITANNNGIIYLEGAFFNESINSRLGTISKVYFVPDAQKKIIFVIASLKKGIMLMK